mmetsp:Transcript_1889/g.5380  ORF Transcript_1889/g.5380 Transcript_1889/m.5380 type:complete len:207 (+) Transcript_1889:254-874(+)
MASMRAGPLRGERALSGGRPPGRRAQPQRAGPARARDVPGEQSKRHHQGGFRTRLAPGSGVPLGAVQRCHQRGAATMVEGHTARGGRSWGAHLVIQPCGAASGSDTGWQRPHVALELRGAPSRASRVGEATRGSLLRPRTHRLCDGGPRDRHATRDVGFAPRGRARQRRLRHRRGAQRWRASRSGPRCRAERGAATGSAGIMHARD